MLPLARKAALSLTHGPAPAGGPHGASAAAADAQALLCHLLADLLGGAWPGRLGSLDGQPRQPGLHLGLVADLCAALQERAGPELAGLLALLCSVAAASACKVGPSHLAPCHLAPWPSLPRRALADCAHAAGAARSTGSDGRPGVQPAAAGLSAR